MTSTPRPTSRRSIVRRISAGATDGMVATVPTSAPSWLKTSVATLLHFGFGGASGAVFGSRGHEG